MLSLVSMENFTLQCHLVTWCVEFQDLDGGGEIIGKQVPQEASALWESCSRGTSS